MNATCESVVPANRLTPRSMRRLWSKATTARAGRKEHGGTPRDDRRAPRQRRTLPAFLPTLRFLIGFLTLWALIAASPVSAGVPEPDNVIWGSIIIGTNSITASDTGVVVEARRSAAGPAFASYRMGASPVIGDRYSLRLAMEDVAPPSSAAASVEGDHIFIVVRDATGVRDAREVVLGGRGLLTKLDFGSADVDGDGLPDTWEERYFGAAGTTPGADFDGDGATNLAEFLGGTDPRVMDARHPADNAPADNYLGITEVTAYGRAWRRGEPWPVAPASIPMDYATRAGVLWKNGEYYRLDSGVVAGAPLWWVNATPPTGSGPDAGEPAGKVSRMKSIAAGGEVVRRISPGIPVAGTVEVNLVCNPSAGVTAWAVEESLPDGWQISGPVDEGYFDPANRKLRFGPFFDPEPRTLVYSITVLSSFDSVATFAGAASFDGESVVTTGNGTLTREGVPPRLRTTRREDGRLLLALEGNASRRYVIERSADLLLWVSCGEADSDLSGKLSFTPEDGDAAGFFRARPAVPAE